MTTQVLPHGGMASPSVSIWAGDTLLNGDGDVIVLDQLSVNWGRKTTTDQPAVGSCSFKLLSEGQAFLSRLQIGTRIDVRADAVIYTVGVTPVPLTYVWQESRNALYSTEMMPLEGEAGFYPVTGLVEDPDDPGFYFIPDVIFPDHEYPSFYSIPGGLLQSIKAPGAAVVVFTPGELVTPGPINSTAWDGYQRTVGGQTWEGRCDVTLPLPFAGYDGWKVVVQPVLYSAPYQGAWTAVGAAVTVLSSAITGTYAVRATAVPAAGGWMGLRVTFYPVGPSWDQVTGAWDSLGTRSWDSLTGATVAGVGMVEPVSGGALGAMVFSGRVTDMTSSWDSDAGQVSVQVIATDERAELANRDVGSAPWLAESVLTRFGHVMSESGTGITYELSPRTRDAVVSWMDVDRQPALTLLEGLANSVDGVLWSSTSLVYGPALYLEAVSDRSPLNTIELVAGVVVIVSAVEAPPSDAVVISAGDLLLEPVKWVNDTADYATRVVVRWRDQTLDDHGLPKPTDRSWEQVDSPAEALWGVYRTSVGTELSTEAAASTLADELLGRLSRRGWRVEQLEWDVGADREVTSDQLGVLMKLLDGTSRLGLPILLTGLPDWSPLTPGAVYPAYLEGGVYRNIGGAWDLQMNVSLGVGQGVAAVKWDDLPSGWKWHTFGTSITWASLAGVGI